MVCTRNPDGGPPAGISQDAGDSGGYPGADSTPSNLSGYLTTASPSGNPKCGSEPEVTTTTVFVTLTSSGVISSLRTLPTDMSSDGRPSGVVTSESGSGREPTTGDLSSGFPVPSSSVQPFTTLTIDIWGHSSGHGSTDGTHTADTSGSGPTSDSGNGKSDQPTATDLSSPPEYTTGPLTGNQGDGTAGSGFTSKTYDSTGGIGPSPDTSQITLGSHQRTSEQSPVSTSAPVQLPGTQPWYTVVTDTDVHWMPGPSGPIPITSFSPHTIVIGNLPAGSVGSNFGSDLNSASSASCITITGVDGKPTVIETGAPHDSGTFPLGSTSAIVDGVSTVSAVSETPIASSFANDGAVSVTTCVTFTVLGSDGHPTITESTFVIPQTQFPLGDSGENPGPVITQSSGLVPWGGAISSELGDITTCLTYTSIDSEGSPIVVESTYVLTTATGTIQNASGEVTITSPAQITGTPGSSSGMG